MDDERLIDQHTAAFVEYAGCDDEASWNSTSGDGLDDYADQIKYPVTEIVTGWWEYHRLFGGSRVERKALGSGEFPSAQWAHDAVCEAVDKGGASAVTLMAALAEAALLETGALAVGVGPLEDLICLHGDELIDEIERTAAAFNPFRIALDSVWLERGALSAATERRLAGRTARVSGRRVSRP